MSKNPPQQKKPRSKKTKIPETTQTSPTDEPQKALPTVGSLVDILVEGVFVTAYVVLHYQNNDGFYFNDKGHNQGSRLLSDEGKTWRRADQSNADPTPKDRHPDGRPLQSVNSSHYYERILRLLVAGIMDALENLNHYSVVGKMTRTLVTDTGDTSHNIFDTNSVDVTEQELEYLSRTDMPYKLTALVTTCFIEATRRLRERVQWFVDEYKKAEKEIGTAEAQGFMTTMHLGYLRGPDEYVVVWRDLVLNLQAAGVELPEIMKGNLLKLRMNSLYGKMDK